MSPEFFIIPLIVTLGLDGHGNAATAAARAYSEQSGLERMLDEYQQREINPTLRTGVADGIWLFKTATERRITFSWGFP